MLLASCGRSPHLFLRPGGFLRVAALGLPWLPLVRARLSCVRSRTPARGPAPPVWGPPVVHSPSGCAGPAWWCLQLREPPPPGFCQGSLRAVRTTQCSHQKFPGARRAQHQAGVGLELDAGTCSSLFPSRAPGTPRTPSDMDSATAPFSCPMQAALLTLRPLLCALETEPCPGVTL